MLTKLLPIVNNMFLNKKIKPNNRLKKFFQSAHITHFWLLNKSPANFQIDYFAKCFLLWLNNDIPFWH